MDKICRICLEEGVLSSIFTKNFNISLCDMLEYCCNIKINKNDGLPEQMCSNCIYKLGIAYHFKQTTENAEVRLRQHLGIQGLQRAHDVAVMTDPIVTYQTIIKKCKCKANEQKKSSSNYKRKPESEKLKRGPKPKPKQIHSCYECDKEFRCPTQLEMHIRTHTGDRPFACMYCSRRFTQKHNLTIHLRVHTGEKPFQCEVCSKRFSAQGNLQAHLKIHSGQRDHVCTVCEKKFITSSDLTRHMNKHLAVKKYKCDLCEATYVNARDFKTHTLKKHQKIPQGTSTHNENFNTSSNIDIIGIDVGKDVPPISEQDSRNMPQLIEKNPETVSGSDHRNNLLPYEHKHVKDICHDLSKTLHENPSCTICGEAFDYMTALAQHYLHHHQGFDYAKS